MCKTTVTFYGGADASGLTFDKTFENVQAVQRYLFINGYEYVDSTEEGGDMGTVARYHNEVGGHALVYGGTHHSPED